MKLPVISCFTACVLASQLLAYDSVVTINEVNYNPPVGQSEWIELRNNQGVDMNVAGWKLTGGVEFTFPTTGVGSTIPGGGHLVIAALPGQIAGSIGPFVGSLNNSGDTIRLRNLNGRIMDELTYDDENDWPVGADGSGATLSRKVAGAESGPGAWTSSTNLGGTPGAQNFALNLPIRTTLIDLAASWKYRDLATAPDPAWNSSSFVDTTWPAGNAPLGAQPLSNSLTVTTNLVERFRASDITGLADGATVTTWTDTATGDGIAQNATGGGTTPPTYRANVVNGKATVRFVATSEARTSTLPGIGATSGWTIFMVVKANAALADTAYLLDRNIVGFPGNPLTSIKPLSGAYAIQKRNDAGAGLGGPNSTTLISQSAFQIVTIRRNRTLSRFEIWVNGVMEGSAVDDGTALTPSPFIIGHHATANSTQGLTGDIAEFLAYGAELSELDFQRVGAYLETEYGLNTAFQTVNTQLAAVAPTSYLRKSFTYSGDPARTLLRLNRTVADGAVFYLNGTELTRTNLPAGVVTHTTTATSSITAPAATGMLPVPATALVNGTNVLAVSLHKGPASSLTFFEASLEAIESPAPPEVAAKFRFNEIAGASAGIGSFYVEIKNNSAAPLSTSGWTLVSSSGQSVALPVQTVAVGGLFSLDAAAMGFTPIDGAKLYLVSGGTTLSDARVVTNRLRGLLSDGKWGHPSSPTPGNANVAVVIQDIVINEIFYKAINGPEQWIELYNKGTATVDLSGWKFSDGVNFDFPSVPATVLAPGGYVVIAWDPAAFTALHPGKTALGPWSGNLSGKGELITLRDANDNITDQLTYAGDGRWSPWASGGGSSLELENPAADNRVAEAWDSSDESGQSTWENVSYSGLGNNATAGSGYTYYQELVLGLLDDGEILIDDIVVREVTNTNVTRNQLVQNGNFSSGTAEFWRNIGTHQFTSIVDDPLSVGNKAMRIVARGATEHMHNHCATTLKDGPNYITLATTSTYTISFRAKWVRGTNRLLSRFYLNRLPKQTLLNRPITGGTPGAVNSRFVANLGPTFADLKVTPVVPFVGQPAVVSVSATDNVSITSTELFTSINGAAFGTTPMTLSNGVWTATIPTQSSGTTVQFYIRSTDALGSSTTFPAAGANSRAMIPWEDGRSQLVMPSGAQPHNLRVVMPAADANDMYLLENVQSNFYRPCTLIYDDNTAYYNASARLKSSEHGRFQANRVGFNVKFGSDELFLGAHGTISIDRSGNASNEGLDGSSITSQREILLKQVMNAAGGIYSQEDDLIRVIPTVASGSPTPAFTGAAALGEAVLSKSRFDDEYLDGQWDNGGSGPLFKQEYIYPLTATIDPTTRVTTAIVAAGNLTAAAEQLKVPQTGGSPGPGGIAVAALAPALTGNPNFTIDPKENYRWHWLIRNGRTDDDYTGVIAAITAVGQVQGSAAFKTQTEAALDVDTWLRAAAVPMMFMVTDNYLGAGATHNFILYFPPGQKGVAIPWDCDFLSQTPANATAFSMVNGGNILKFTADGANKRRYWCHVLDILNRSFNDAFLTQWANHYSRFGPDNVASSLPVLRTRANHVRDLIMGTNVAGGNATLSRVIPATNFMLTTAGPLNVSTPFATVAGDGWLDVDQIRLQGTTVALQTTWTDENSWSVQVPLGGGTRTYVLEGYRKDGSLIGNVSISITATGITVPADATNIVISELNYHPADSVLTPAYPNDDDFEWIELRNISPSPVEMLNCSFTNGITYTFTTSRVISPGGTLVIPRRAAAFAITHPGVPVAPEYYLATDPTGNQFSNGGEQITLLDALGRDIKRFVYDDITPWPTSPDGLGKTLVLISPFSNPDHNNPLNWRASLADKGAPGASDGNSFTGTANADTNNNGITDLTDFAIGSGAIPSAALVPDPTPSFIFTLDRDVTSQTSYLIELSTDLTSGGNPGSWQAVVNPTMVSRAPLTGNVERLTFSIPVAPAGTNRMFIRAKFNSP